MLPPNLKKGGGDFWLFRDFCLKLCYSCLFFLIFKATVLQPAMKKKKSVSKLEVKDVTNSEKYVLQHQEQDSHGEVETQLFKV